MSGTQSELHRSWMLPVLFAGQIMAAMDTSLANVAGPALHDSLQVSGALLQIIISGYVLAYALLLVTGARLGDQFGYREAYAAGAAVFTVASLLCGLAPEPYTLVVARVLQGAGAAIMVPQVLSIIQRSFEGPARAKAIGYYSIVLGLAVSAGQLLGGAAVSLDLFGLGWRLAFLVNVPVGIWILAKVRTALPRLQGSGRAEFDVAGILLLAAAMLALVVPLTFGREAGWPAWAGACLALGALGLTGFVRLERIVARRGGVPVLDMTVFENPGVKARLLVVFAGFISYGGLLFSVATYLQAGLQFSPVQSALVFVSYSIGFAAANMLWPKLSPGMLRWIPSAALVVVLSAAAALSLACDRWGWSSLLFIPLLFLCGSGQGLSYGPTVSRLAASVPPAHAPALSGLVVTATQLAIALGIAGLGAVYFSNAADPHTAMSIVALAVAMISAPAMLASLRLAKGGA